MRIAVIPCLAFLLSCAGQAPTPEPRALDDVLVGIFGNAGWLLTRDGCRPAEECDGDVLLCCGEDGPRMPYAAVREAEWRAECTADPECALFVRALTEKGGESPASITPAPLASGTCQSLPLDNFLRCGALELWTLSEAYGIDALADAAGGCRPLRAHVTRLAAARGWLDDWVDDSGECLPATRYVLEFINNNPRGVSVKPLGVWAMPW